MVSSLDCESVIAAVSDNVFVEMEKGDRFIILPCIYTYGMAPNGNEVTVEDVAQMVRERARSIDQDPDEVVVREDHPAGAVVYWEGGPWEWAVEAIGGGYVLGKRLFDEIPENVDAETRHALVVY